MEESKIAVLGLAYKGETSDIRESQAILLVRELRKMGAKVAVHDPYVTSPPEDIEIKSLEEVAKEADCIVIATEHSKFREMSLEYLAKLVRKPCALVDARAIFDPIKAKKLGFIWRGLGRP
jgi:UDP-N-acetyl-D-mannosaminuronate dehydrogenase